MFLNEHRVSEIVMFRFCGIIWIKMNIFGTFCEDLCRIRVRFR